LSALNKGEFNVFVWDEWDKEEGANEVINFTALHVNVQNSHLFQLSHKALEEVEAAGFNLEKWG
jgi:hypothetical protein